MNPHSLVSITHRFSRFRFPTHHGKRRYDTRNTPASQRNGLNSSTHETKPCRPTDGARKDIEFSPSHGVSSWLASLHRSLLALRRPNQLLEYLCMRIEGQFHFNWGFGSDLRRRKFSLPPKLLLSRDILQQLSPFCVEETPPTLRCNVSSSRRSGLFSSKKL